MSNRQMAGNPVIVTRENSAGAFVAAFVAVLLIALAVWLFGFRGADTTSGTGTDVNVTIDDGSGSSGSGSDGSGSSGGGESTPDPSTPGY